MKTKNDHDRQQPSRVAVDKPFEKQPISKKMERIANEAAGRGRARQRRDEAGKDVIVQSDGHGSSNVGESGFD
jgi:hypothetical protein